MYSLPRSPLPLYLLTVLPLESCTVLMAFPASFHKLWGCLGGGEVSGSRFRDGLCNALVGPLDVVVVKVCGYLQVVGKFVKSRLEGCNVVVGGITVEFGGMLAHSGLSPFHPNRRCYKSVVGVEPCGVVSCDVMEASPPLSAANEQVELYPFSCGSEVSPFLVRVLPHPCLWEAHFLSSHESK